MGKSLEVIQCRRNLSTADGGHDLGPSVVKTIEKGRNFKPIEKGRVFPLIPASLRLQPILPRTTAQPKKTNEQKSSVASYLPILSKKFNKKASDYRAPNGEDPKLSRNESEQSKQSSDSSIMSSVESVVSRMRASSPNSVRNLFRLSYTVRVLAHQHRTNMFDQAKTKAVGC